MPRERFYSVENMLTSVKPEIGRPKGLGVEYKIHESHPVSHPLHGGIVIAYYVMCKVVEKL